MAWSFGGVGWVFWIRRWWVILGFLGSPEVGRFGFLDLLMGFEGIGSVVVVVNENLLYLVAKKIVNKMLFV